ncbi:MAG: ATP-binding protein [Microthrixaceae bacterium]
MDEARLRDLIAGGETLTVEFKSPRLQDERLVEAATCLANGDGGFILLGVKDSGELRGEPPRHGDRTRPERVVSLIANKTRPPLNVAVEVIDLDGMEVVTIEVPAAHMVTATSSGKYLRRAMGVKGEPECIPMAPHEVISRAGSIGEQDFSHVAMSTLDLEDLDAAEFERMRRLARAGGDEVLASLTDEEALKALDLVARSGELTVGALLLFGSEASIAELLPTHEVRFQELVGLEIRSQWSGRVPLLRAMFEVADRVMVRDSEAEVTLGLQRVSRPLFDAVAVRELIANALVHRDYARRGTVLVQISDRVLTISNPGGFPLGVTVDNLLSTPPTPRNHTLADVFKRAGLVDRTSRGINRVFERQLGNGRPPPDYSDSSGESVVVRLTPGNDASTFAAATSLARVWSAGDLSLDQLRVLYEIDQNGRISVAEVAQMLRMEEMRAKHLLGHLATEGLLQASPDRAVYRFESGVGQYVLGPAQGPPSDRTQMERLIDLHVQKHGSISRAEAAELGGIEPVLAGRILRQMRDDGRLAMVGERRGTRYIMP